MSDELLSIRARHIEDEAEGPFAGRRSEQARQDRAWLLAEIERLRGGYIDLQTSDPNTVLRMPVARPTLTDAEQEAIAAAARIIDAYDEEMDGFPSGAADSLRGLLARSTTSTREGTEP